MKKLALQSIKLGEGCLRARDSHDITFINIESHAPGVTLQL